MNVFVYYKMYLCIDMFVYYLTHPPLVLHIYVVKLG